MAQKYYSDGLPLEVKNKDEKALKVLESVFPDRKVIAINTLALNSYGGGIHCNTRNIPAI
ncbi:TPA: agmatine deiminase family protein [Bacillus cereus]